MTITEFAECENAINQLRQEIKQLKEQYKAIDYLPGEVTRYTNKAKEDYHEFTEKMYKEMYGFMDSMNEKMKKLIYWIVGSVLVSLILGTAGLVASQYVLYDKIHDVEMKIVEDKKTKEVSIR